MLGTNKVEWLAAEVMGGLLLLPHLASRLIVGWLYNTFGSRVLSAGMFHAMHNVIVNTAGLGVAVLGLPQIDVLAIMSGLVILTGVIVTVATHAPRPPIERHRGQLSPAP